LTPFPALLLQLRGSKAGSEGAEDQEREQVLSFSAVQSGFHSENIASAIRVSGSSHSCGVCEGGIYFLYPFVLSLIEWEY
jgi:hypothetical protein